MYANVTAISHSSKTIDELQNDLNLNLLKLRIGYIQRNIL